MSDDRKWYRRNWEWDRIRANEGAGERVWYDGRNTMRLWAQNYAEARGWTVALTPPQRQKGSKRG